MEAELEDAYRRAGRAFQGQLQQYFVVLRDRESYPVVVNRGASAFTPRKRQREDEAKGQEQNRGSKRGSVVKGKMG